MAFAPVCNDRQAILIVDMLNDFVTGALKCDRAQRIIPPLQRLIKAARQKGVYVIYCNDAHLRGVDWELQLWGDHAIAGTSGAQVIPELQPAEGDFIVPKRRYSGFFQTDLHILLTELHVGTVIMAGMHAHMCVRHTAADAYQYGYHVVVPTDCVESFTQADFESGVKYLKETYGARITTADELIEEF